MIMQFAQTNKCYMREAWKSLTGSLMYAGRYAVSNYLILINATEKVLFSQKAV